MIPETEATGVPIHIVLILILLAALATAQWFTFMWAWRIDKFLVVLAIGSEKMAMYGYQPQSDQQLLTGTGVTVDQLQKRPTKSSKIR